MYKEFYFTKAHDEHVRYENEVVKRDDLMVTIKHNETLQATPAPSESHHLRKLMKKATFASTAPENGTPYLSVIYDDLDSADEQFYYLNVTPEDIENIGPDTALALLAEHTPLARNLNELRYGDDLWVAMTLHA